MSLGKIFEHRGHGERRDGLSQSFALPGRGVPFHRFGLIAIPFLLVNLFLFSATCIAQENPVLKVDEDISRFAYSAGGRIAFATRHVFSVKKIQLQRDDIWVAEQDGKKHRILLGEKFVRGTGPFSYVVRGLRWSPDGSKIAAELGTSEMINDDGDTREGVMTLLLDNEGREITIPGADSVIPGATNAAWMADGATVVYLTAVPPEPNRPMSEKPPDKNKSTAFVINRVTSTAGPGSFAFAGSRFAAVAWNAINNTGVAVVPNHLEALPPDLVVLDLTRESSRVLTTLQGFAGGLSISPSGKRVAYWIDNESLEVREVDNPNRVARVRVPIGTLAWSADETSVLVKRGPALRSGGLAWIVLPPVAATAAGTTPRTAEVAPRSILHDLEFRQFEISPDGRFLGVVEPGKRNLLVYPVT